MGSTFTKKEASIALGVSERTVYHYIEKGYLRREKHNELVCVNKEDVLELKRLKDSDLPYPVNKLTLALMNSKILRLEAEMEVVKRMLNMRAAPLGLSTMELVSAYGYCAHVLKEPSDIQDLNMWVDLFIRLRTEDLESISSETKDAHPWRPFYSLCLLLAELHKEEKALEGGLANLKSIITIWTETRGVSIKRTDRLQNVAKKVVRKIVANSAKTRKI